MYNCKQALDCSQGDIQVISRKVEGKLLEIWLMFLGTSGVRRKVENGLHLIQVWCTAGSLVFVDEAEVSSGTVIDKLDSGDRRLGTSIVLTRYNSVACYRIGVQPYFARESF